LGDQRIKDPALLKLICVSLEAAVLITFDNKMSIEHRLLLDQYGTTLAVVDKDGCPPHLTREQYWRDVIHHHAHRFAGQAAGSRLKYRQRGRRPIK
jgi:cysteine synthase